MHQRNGILLILFNVRVVHMYSHIFNGDLVTFRGSIIGYYIQKYKIIIQPYFATKWFILRSSCPDEFYLQTLSPSAHWDQTRYSRSLSLQAEHNRPKIPEREGQELLNTEQHDGEDIISVCMNTHREHGHPCPMSGYIETLCNVKLWHSVHEVDR